MFTLKSESEIKILAQGGHKLALILKQLSQEVKPGVDTAYLEGRALDLIFQAGGEAAFKNYDMGGGLYFPTALCISINDEVVHGPALPARVLQSGDIVDIDIGMRWPRAGGLYTDTCVSLPVGKVSDEAKKLLRVTRESLNLAIKQVKPGRTINDIGQAIENYIKLYGYGIVRDLVGHGVGYEPHEDPAVYHYAINPNSADNISLQPGLVIAIEPMINLGTYRVKTAADGLTVITADGSLSAHFEHTVAVTKTGCQILTI